MAGVREQKKKETRQSIVAAAILLFGKKGFDRTSIEDIATTAGVGKGTIYGYFSNKQEIFLAFCDEEIENSFRVLRETVDPGAPLLQQLVTLFMIQFRYLTENHEFGRHLFREVAFPKLVSQTTIEHDLRYIEMLKKLLEIAQQNGQIKTDVLLETASAGLYMLYMGCVSAWYSGHLTELSEVEGSMTRLFEQLLEGIGS